MFEVTYRTLKWEKFRKLIHGEGGQNKHGRLDFEKRL